MRRHRKSVNNAKNLAAVREEAEMRELWGVVGGFLLGAVFGPRLIRTLSRSSWGDKLAEIMRRGIPEPAISPFVVTPAPEPPHEMPTQVVEDMANEALRASYRAAERRKAKGKEKACPRASGRKVMGY